MPCPILSTFPVHSTHAMMSGGRKKRPLFNYCPPLSMSVREIRSAGRAGRRSKRTNYGICKSSRSSGSVARARVFGRPPLPPSLPPSFVVILYLDSFCPGYGSAGPPRRKGERTDILPRPRTTLARSLARAPRPPEGVAWEVRDSFRVFT